MMEKNFEAFMEAYKKLKDDGRSFVTVTLVNSRGSAPQDMGSRMITDGEQVLFGTIGGGKVEAKVIKEAKDLLRQENKISSHHFRWNLQRDVGMTCGGEVSLFMEVSRGDVDWNIVVFGAGHVSQELTRILSRLNCKVTCIDHRKEWLLKLSSEKLNVVCMEEPKEYVKEIPEGAFVVLMTMGHGTDVPILEEILKTRTFPYVGVIGSEAKSRLLRSGMKKAGVEKQKVDSFICPIGEPLGDNSPAEIAVSVVSQLIKVKDRVLRTRKRN